MKFSRLYPRGPISAFLYGSLIPICACSTIPFLMTLRGKVRFRTIIVFVMSAPLLSPVIIFLSFSVLGAKYAVLRIICSFILSVSVGYFMELFYKSEEDINFNAAVSCGGGCEALGSGIIDETLRMSKQLLPYILFAGLLSSIFSIFQKDTIIYFVNLLDSWYGIVIAVIIGIPLYVCNGADIFLLRPILNSEFGLPYGQAIAFSLSSSIICLPSIVLLSKVLGKKLTGILVAYIFAACLLIGFILKLSVR